MNHLEGSQLKIIQAEENAAMVRSAFGMNAKHEIDWKGKVLSIHLQSNRPNNFVKMLDHLEETADDLNSFEVIVKIDDDDLVMNELLKHESTHRKFTVKYIS